MSESPQGMAKPPPHTGSSLLPHHRDHLLRRGLSDQAIVAAKVFSTVDGDPAPGALGGDGLVGVPAMAFPVFGIDGALTATWFRQDLSIIGTSASMTTTETVPGLYFPPTIPWRAVCASDDPIFLTDEIEEALLLAQEGRATIASLAPGGFLDLLHHQLTGTDRLHPGLNGIELAGREVYLAFFTSSPRLGTVVQAEARTGYLLSLARAKTKIVRATNKSGERIDLCTYLALVSQADRAAAIAAIERHALDVSPWERACAVAAIGDWWFQLGLRVALLNDPSFWAGLRLADALTVARTREILNVTPADWEEKQVSMEHVLEMDPIDEAGPDLQPRLRAAARDLLRDPALLDRYHASLRAGGLVGEEKAADLVLLAYVSRRQRPINLVVKAQSSTGKNFLVESALAHCPPDDVELVSGLSPSAINYLAPDAWKHRVVVLAEQEAGNRSEYQIRTLQSENVVVTLTAKMSKRGKIGTKKRTVEGPTCFISTTTRASLHPENETRVLEVTLDESKAQTTRIIDKTLASAGGDGRAADRELELSIWRTALGMVGVGEVVVPLALHEPLKSAVNLDRIRARRDVTKLISLTKASALLFAEQRERDPQGRIIATEQDAARATDLAGALKARLSPQMDRIAALLRERFAAETFTNAQAAVVLGFSEPDSARKKMLELESAEILSRADRDGSGGRSGRPATRWRLNQVDGSQPSPGHTA